MPHQPESRTHELIASVFSGTPGRLRVFGAIAIVACVLFGLVGFASVTSLNAALKDSRDHAAQLVRIQTVRTNLVAADANATNAFLVGGLEPPLARAGYEKGIDTAAATLTQASSSGPSDAAALSDVNRTLATYSGLIEAARANNRQGYPVGAAYLREASKTLRDDALPPLEHLVTVERANVADATAAAEGIEGVMAGLLALCFIALAVTQIWLYRKTHRILNRPLLTATVVITLFGVVALATMTWSQVVASDARSGPYKEMVDLTQARIAAFDAKSAENLTLIVRGNGQAYEDSFKQLSVTATTALGDAATGLPATSDEARTKAAFAAFAVEHKKVREADDKGSWDEAVASATGTGAANQSFATFEQLSAKALAQQSTQLSDDLNHARLPLTALAWLVALAGIIGLVLSWRGISQRLREYR